MVRGLEKGKVEKGGVLGSVMMTCAIVCEEGESVMDAYMALELAPTAGWIEVDVRWFVHDCECFDGWVWV